MIENLLECKTEGKINQSCISSFNGSMRVIFPLMVYLLIIIVFFTLYIRPATARGCAAHEALKISQLEINR